MPTPPTSLGAALLLSAALLASPALAQVPTPTPVSDGEAAAPAAPPAHAVPAAPRAQPLPPPPPPPPPAPPPRAPPPRARTSFSFGGGYAGGSTYLVAGGRVAYPLVFGLEADVQGQWWFGASPNIAKLAPGLTLTLPLRNQPYVGAYWARWFVGGGRPDQSAVGARAGVTVLNQGRLGVTAGVNYERQLRCTGDCDVWTPEVAAGISF